MTREKMKRLPEKEQELVRLWLERPKDKRTANDVRAFYGWLTQNCPHLSPQSHGDAYQAVFAIIRKYERAHQI